MRIAILLFLPLAASAADSVATKQAWTEFRGTDGAGHYVGPKLPQKWGPDTNVVWKTPIPGHGWSSPIYLAGKIFLTTAIPQGEGKQADQSLRAICVDAKEGKILWDVEVFLENGKTAPKPHAKNSHASPTPITDGDRLYVHFGHMGTAALDLKGKILWKSQEHTYIPLHGNGGSPVLVDGELVIICDGLKNPFVAALDCKTGKTRWKAERSWNAFMKFSFATPLVITVDGQKQVVAPGSDAVAAYDPKDGKEIWKVTYPKQGWSLIAQPVYDHGLVFVATGFMNQHLIAFDPKGTGDLTANIKWKTFRNAPNTPTPIAVGDELYSIADSGICTCYDSLTGKVHWAERLPGTAYSASPIMADGLIYTTSEEGIGAVIRAGKQFKVVSKSDLAEPTFATFLPVDGSLYVRTKTLLYRFQEK